MSSSTCKGLLAGLSLVVAVAKAFRVASVSVRSASPREAAKGALASITVPTTRGPAPASSSSATLRTARRRGSWQHCSIGEEPCLERVDELVGALKAPGRVLLQHLQ